MQAINRQISRQHFLTLRQAKFGISSASHQKVLISLQHGSGPHERQKIGFTGITQAKFEIGCNLFPIRSNRGEFRLQLTIRLIFSIGCSVAICERTKIGRGRLNKFVLGHHLDPLGNILGLSVDGGQRIRGGGEFFESHFEQIQLLTKLRIRRCRCQRDQVPCLRKR